MVNPAPAPGPIALVTGGRARIGAAIARRLAHQGYRLAIHCRSAKTREDDAHGHGTNSALFVADLADPVAAEGLVTRVAEHFGTLPALIVNNAAKFDTHDHDDVKTIAAFHAVNAAAPITIALAFARLGGRGCVVNILDQRVRNPNRDQIAYTLAKSALAAATRPLAMRLAPDIRVNAVAPGFTIANPEHHPAQQERVRDAMPMSALPEPEDIAEAVAYFAGAACVTGQTLFVDSGAHLRGFERDFLYF